MSTHQQIVPHCPDCGIPAGAVHTPECPTTGTLHRVVDGDRSNLPAAMPLPGEVIKSPYAELALDKIAPEQQRTVLDEIGTPARRVGVPMPDPFDDPALPDELRRQHRDRS